MSGIFPQEHAGGLPVRDENGQPIVYDNVENAYVPPADFSVTCSINYLPSDCTARFEPRQLNALQSELLSFAVRLDPQGTWDCDSVTNLPRMFNSWLASDDFYNNISTSVCTRAGTHTKTAAQARVLRMLHCTADGIQASTYGNLIDVSLCGYGNALTVDPNWGIITCGANGPVKVSYEVLYNYLYARMGIEQLKEDVLALQGDVTTIKQQITQIITALDTFETLLNNIFADLNVIRQDIVDIKSALDAITDRVTALENNQITGASFDTTTYDITLTRQSANSFVVDLTPIKTEIDGKFNKPTGSTTQYIRGDGTLGNISVFQAVSQKNQANGYAGLDASGKIPESLIPALAISEPFVVANQAAMLALTAQTGDVAIRTDINESFILKTAPASTLANWIKVLTPPSGIVSIAGLTNPNISQAELRTALGLGSAAYQPESAFVKPTGGAGDYIKGDGTIAPFPSVPGAQVQTDWNATSGIASIKNKPTNFVFGDGTASQYIRGDGTKATLPTAPAQVQSNWNETNTSSPAFIQNKPTIPNVSDVVRSSDTEVIGYNGSQSLPFIKKRNEQSYRDLATKDYVDARVGSPWPGVSWADASGELNFPVGHTVLATGSVTPQANLTTSPRLNLNGTSGYVGDATSGGGNRLNGTWKTRGGTSSLCLYQRVG